MRLSSAGFAPGLRGAWVASLALSLAAPLLAAPGAGAGGAPTVNTTAGVSGAVSGATPAAGGAAGLAGTGGAVTTALPDPAKTCVEHFPTGKERPSASEQFPAKGTSGYVAWLEVAIEHGKGESVLPSGFQLQGGSDEAKVVESAGFALPDPTSPLTSKIKTEARGSSQLTSVSIPFILLPKEPGRKQLTLPSVPLAIARASGELITLCTAPHTITVEDPIANEPQPQPKENFKPLRQMEEWTLLKNISYGTLLGLALAGLAFWLFRIWQRHWRKAPPAPPPRPAWDVALEALRDLRNARLIEQERYADHFDRVSDIVRRYLGDRYGFDGLESTTREALAQLEPSITDAGQLELVRVFLRKADLVKFARVTPTEAECHHALERGEHIVHSTMPALIPYHGAVHSAPTTPNVPPAAHERPPEHGDRS